MFCQAFHIYYIMNFIFDVCENTFLCNLYTFVCLYAIFLELEICNSNHWNDLFNKWIIPLQNNIANIKITVIL